MKHMQPKSGWNKGKTLIKRNFDPDETQFKPG